MADLKKLAEEIVGLTLLEAQELKTFLKDEYGIEPAAGGAVKKSTNGAHIGIANDIEINKNGCLLYTSPSPRD